jgi:hypothetical protein
VAKAAAQNTRQDIIRRIRKILRREYERRKEEEGGERRTASRTLLYTGGRRGFALISLVFLPRMS